MLSIGKVGLTRKQQLYYEEKVAKGGEDYYAGRGEAAGRWTGAGAELLGLSGDLDVEQLKAMMDGRHPLSGEQLASRSGNTSVAALDLTFSAPKSVSVLFTAGDERLSRALVEAHEEAVDAALSYMEREACRVRRGHNGTKKEREAGDPRGWQRAQSEPAAGFVAAAYRHRMSRAQDPQLHTHVVCANMGRGQDGRWTALDGRAIYDHAKAGGCVYEAHLRLAVKERVPWAEWGPVREGIAELAVVSAEVREEFSQRRRRILDRERELEAAGVVVGFEGRERIAYDTREAKREIPEPDWRAEVRSRAAEHGLGRTEIERLGQLPRSPAQEKISEGDLGRRLFSAGGLTATQNTFQRRDAVIGVACEHAQGASAEEVVLLAERLLRRPEVVPVGFGVDRRYTTRELLTAEDLIVRHAEEGKGRRAGALDQGQVGTALEHLPRQLSDEQRQVALAIASSGNWIDTIEALAGTGKTTAAGALKEVYEQAGYRVVGAGPTARSVRELKERAGIGDSRTLDGWAVKLAAEPDALSFAQATETGLRRQPAVMIVDEAGMAHTRISAEVIEQAMAARVKVIAIGDSGQLSSVRAGGWLGALTRRLGSQELREVMRQRDPLERRALAKVHRGEPANYLELKRRRGELRVFTGEQPGNAAEETLIERWLAARECHGTQDAVMICRDNARRERLNELARAELRELGMLGESIELGNRQWAVGDRVIARRNERGRDIDNGSRGTIAAVDDQTGVIVRLDAGGTRQLDCDYLDRHVEHGYALTGHGMQGGTVGWAGVIGQARDFSRNWSYTALSRAREPVEIFLVDEPSRLEQEREDIAPAQATDARQDPFERMEARMRERDDEDLALEQLQYAELARRDGPERHNRGQAPATQLAGVDPDDPTGVGSVPRFSRARVYELDEQLRAIGEELRSTAIDNAKRIRRIEQTISAVEREQERDLRPRNRRDRGGHKTRKHQREHQLAELREQRARLLDETADTDAVLKRAAELRERQRDLATQHQAARDRAIHEELAQRPPWLHAALGPEPRDRNDQARWQRTAREIAGHRIDHRITDPHAGLGRGVRDPALKRAIDDTRAVLGLEVSLRAADAGLER